jgi:flavin-dependent dehydrogenase
VALFDHTHPREKPCGGGVTGRALGVVSAAIALDRLPAVVVHGAEIDDPHTAPVHFSLDARGPTPASSLVVVDRRSFDLALLEAAVAAGAQHVAARAVEVEANGAGATVRTSGGTFAASWVIGADGANSLVRRRLSRPFSRAQLSTAVGWFAHGVTSRDILVRFVDEPSGYIWSFPRRDHLAIGICAQADMARAAALRQALADWVGTRGLGSGAQMEAYGWPIPSLGVADLDGECPSDGRWLLAGDAAGLVDPITREGIFFALQSGQFAAEALCGPGAPPATYTERLRAHVYPELRRAARLKHGFFRGGFTPLLVDALRQSASVRALMIGLVAGRQPYATLKRRLVQTFEIGLAWRLLRLELERPRR